MAAELVSCLHRLTKRAASVFKSISHSSSAHWATRDSIDLDESPVRFYTKHAHYFRVRSRNDLVSWFCMKVHLR
ncbi:hypothetical protein KC322_g114 [Hortaea werneckii]|nr:hypothetical protein KC322_g114 [Hortaea werneckii]